MSKPRKPKSKSFTVRLDIDDYRALQTLGAEHKPPLSLQYIVTFALQRFLRDAGDPQLRLQLGDPLARM
jgi:hypothetical protein